MKIQNFKISNFNTLIILFLILVFTTLFYFSIPNIYDKYEIQKHLTEKIKKKYPFIISLSPEITYSILPKPHFRVDNTKLSFPAKDGVLEIGEAKQVDIFVSNANFFNIKKIKIKEIKIEKSDLRIDKENIKKFQELLDLKIDKTINFSDTKIYIKEDKKFKSIINLILLKKIKINYDEEGDYNILNAEGKLFNKKSEFSWKNNLSNQDVSLKLNIDSLNLNIESKSKKKGNLINSTKIQLNRSYLLQDSVYDKKNKIVNINSQKSKVNNSNLNYTGQINLDPFYFNFDSEIEKLSLKKIYKKIIIVEQLIKNFFFGNDSLNGDIKIKINNFENNRFLKDGNFNLEFKNKKFNIDGTKIIVSKDIGLFEIKNSNINLKQNEVLFNCQVDFEIINQSNFYKTFLIPKNKRIDLSNLSFYVNYNITTNEMFISDPRINDSEKTILFTKSANINKWVHLKNYINQIFSVYDG